MSIKESTKQENYQHGSDTEKWSEESAPSKVAGQVETTEIEIKIVQAVCLKKGLDPKQIATKT